MTPEHFPSSGQPATGNRSDAPAIDELPARSSPPGRDSKRPLLLHWATEASVGDAYKPFRHVVAVAEVGPGPNWPKLGDWRGFACKRHWISIPNDAPNAYDILNSICFDILNVQIGTSMFWKTDEELREDHFAEYVHYWLLKASKDLGWEHDDSSAVWK